MKSINYGTNVSNRVSDIKSNEDNLNQMKYQPKVGEIPPLEKKLSSMGKAYSQQVFVSNQEIKNLYDIGQKKKQEEINRNQNTYNYTSNQRSTYTNYKEEQNTDSVPKFQTQYQKNQADTKAEYKLDLLGENDKNKNLASFSKQVASPKGLINNFNLNKKKEEEKVQQTYVTYKQQVPEQAQNPTKIPTLEQKTSNNSNKKYQQTIQPNLDEQLDSINQIPIKSVEKKESSTSNQKRRSLTPQYNQQYKRNQNIQNTQNLHKQITTTTHYLGNKRITIKTEEDSHNNKRIVTKITEEMDKDGKTVLSKEKVTSIIDISNDYMSSKKLAEIEKTMNKEEKEKYFNDMQLLAQQNSNLNSQNTKNYQNFSNFSNQLSVNNQLNNKSDNLNQQFSIKSEFMKSYDPVMDKQNSDWNSNKNTNQNLNINLNIKQDSNQNQNQNKIEIKQEAQPQPQVYSATPISVAQFNEIQNKKKHEIVQKTNSNNSNNYSTLQVQDSVKNDNMSVISGKPSFSNQKNESYYSKNVTNNNSQSEFPDLNSQRVSLKAETQSVQNKIQIQNQNSQNQVQNQIPLQTQNSEKVPVHSHYSQTQYQNKTYLSQNNSNQEQQKKEQNQNVSYYNVPKRNQQKNQRISYSLAEGSSKEYRTLSNLLNQQQNQNQNLNQTQNQKQDQNQDSQKQSSGNQINNNMDDTISNIESAKSKTINLDSNQQNIDVQSINSSKYGRDYTPQYSRHGIVSNKHQNGVSSFSNNVSYLQNKNKNQNNYFFGDNLSELQIQREGSEKIEPYSNKQQKDSRNQVQSGNSLIRDIQHEKIQEKPSIMEESNKNSTNQNFHHLGASKSKSQEKYQSQNSYQQPSNFLVQHQQQQQQKQQQQKNQNQNQSLSQGQNSGNNLSHMEQVKQQDRFYALNLLNKYKQHTQSLRGDSPGGNSDFQFNGGQQGIKVIKTVHKSATPRNDAENLSWQQVTQNQKQDSSHSNQVNYPGKDVFQKNEENKLSNQKDKNIKKMPFPQAYRWSLKNFSIFKALGKGIFGTVYLAKEKTNNYLMALKVMEKSKIHEMNLVDQTMKELKIHYYLEHPNILQCYGYFPTQTQLIMALEYCYGGNLYEKLYKQPNRRFGEQEGANYIAQIISAVQYLHKNHIIHRDIKPENILLNNDTVKLSDFGIASFNDGMRQTFCGTLEYVSPEIIDRQLYDYNVDVWAIGVLAYEICNGDPPFMGRDQKKIIKNVAFNMPRHFSAELKDFVNCLLRKNPNERMDLEQAMKHPWIQKNCVLYSQKSEKANLIIGQQQTDLFL